MSDSLRRLKDKFNKPVRYIEPDAAELPSLSLGAAPIAPPQPEPVQAKTVPRFVRWSMYKNKYDIFNMLEFYGDKLTVVFDKTHYKQGLTLALEHYRRHTLRMIVINKKAANIAEIEFVKWG